jgi:hypothetical protein
MSSALAGAAPPTLGAADRCAEEASTTWLGTVKLAAGIAGGLTVTTCAVALVVGLTVAAGARQWLVFPFAGLPARPAEAASIFDHNLRALGAVAGLLLTAQSPYWAGRACGGRLHRAIRGGAETLLGAGIAANVIVVGASLGAYGIRMVTAVLPHGPVELAAYALALALYLEGRKRRLALAHILGIATLSVTTLALAAALEAFVNL